MLVSLTEFKINLLILLLALAIKFQIITKPFRHTQCLNSLETSGKCVGTKLCRMVDLQEQDWSPLL